MNQYRCETCKHYVDIADDNGKFRYTDCDIKFGHGLTTEEENFTCRMGCASHSDFQSEQDKLDVLDIELEATKSRIESSAMGQPLSERSRGEIIGLLHAREKIKYLRQAGEP